jgi:DNA-directed RNA polymerase specialized sigma24 family protein
MKKEYSYYSVDEFVIALSTLSQTDKKKLLLFGIKYCRDYSLESEGDDLFQEAITRFISGSRKAAKEVAVLISLFNAMKSVGNSMLKSKNQQLRDVSTSIEDNEYSVNNKINAEVNDEQYDVLDELKHKLIMVHFGDDTEVLSMIELIGEGVKAREIADIMFDGDRKRYDTTYKRFMRKRKQIRTEAASV